MANKSASVGWNARTKIVACLICLQSILIGQKPTKTEVSYTNDIGPIVSNYCATCHSGEDPDGGFVLVSYKDVKRLAEKGKLTKRINDKDDPMPPAGLMSKRQRGLFQSWIDGGFINKGDPKLTTKYPPFRPPVIKPVDISQQGYEFMSKLQGHWVGSMNFMRRKMPWFAWDYRAIAPSHIHGIFEGGTLGNLFTSFFVAGFKGTKTIMARHGGVLNDTYRTSYFVLDRVTKKDGGTEYRFVDAYGGAGIMWMSLRFTKDKLDFVSYTSRLGMTGRPTQHMNFVGRKMHPELAAQAAKAVGFPKKFMAYDYPDGLPIPDWGRGVPVTSYSYIWEKKGKSIVELGKLSADPIRIDQMPHLSELTIDIPRDKQTAKAPLEVYLSREPLTDKAGKILMEMGYPKQSEFDGILMFSRLTAGEKSMTFTYLHPGTYYLTVVADLNKDEYPSAGDLSHASVRIVVKKEKKQKVTAPKINVKN